MKTIICVNGRSNIGKTSTILEVVNKLTSNSPINLIDKDNRDILVSIDISSTIRVGISSQGDPGSHQKEWLLRLVSEFRCEIIVCAARSYGDTVDFVKKIAEQNGYQVIWFTPCHTYNDNANELHRTLNMASASMVIDLIYKSIPTID